MEYVTENYVSDAALDRCENALVGVRNRFKEMIENQNDSVLFKKRRYPPKLKAILMAVEAADPAEAKLGDPLKSSEIASVIADYREETDLEWVQKVTEKFTNSRNVAIFLSKQADKEDGHTVSVNRQDEGENEFTLEYKIGNYKQIDVAEIEDLLELPCMQNLHDRLLAGKPTRWELYSFVRYILEVNVGFDIDDIKNWFEHYPWYREDITEYQAKYEQRQVMQDGERPMPISCSNDNRNWSGHCIGKENCEYNLYGSVELRPDVYKRAGNN